MSEPCFHENINYLGMGYWQCEDCGKTFDEIDRDEILKNNQDRKIAALQAENAELKRAAAYADTVENHLSLLREDLAAATNREIGYQRELSTLRESMRKIADWDGVYGTFPEANNKDWAVMAIMAARSAYPLPEQPADSSDE